MERMRELVDILNIHAHKYYVLYTPTISDGEFDKLYDELVLLESSLDIVLDNSPTKRVGGEPIKQFGTYKHKQKLYSLDKCQSAEGFISWYNKSVIAIGHNPKVTVEYKFDGVTINILYKGGKLISASTRGNGVIGEDVTEQIKTIKSVPLSIDFEGEVEVQGEGIMRLSVLKQYNEQATEPLKNARNGAAGAVRNLNPKVTASRRLDVFSYNIGYCNGKEFNSQQEMYDFLVNQGFLVGAQFTVSSDQEEILGLLNSITNEREKLDFLIDGVVIKLDDVRDREIVGYTEKFPKWAIAYKFKADEVTTIVNDVIWQVSRTAKLNPLAILEPVELAGVLVSKATLNNYNDIQKKGIKLGASVFVRRSNDVIPEIVGIAELYEHSKEIEKPVICPACSSLVEERGSFLYCTNNVDCVPQIVSAWSHFASKEAMNIEGVSEKTAEQLINEYKYRTIADIYRIDSDSLQGLEGFKDKKIANTINSINASKTTTLNRFLYGLGIANIGKIASRELANKYHSLDALKDCTVDKLLEINDFGEIMAQGVYDYFHNSIKLALIEDFIMLGIVIEEEQIIEGSFSDVVVVLTGSLIKFKRSQAEQLIISKGGRVSNTVSKSVNLIIAGEEAGSKLVKAQKLGIKIINEDEFESMLSKL